MLKKNQRKCVIFNYIPHKVTKKVYFNVWLNEYYNHLINLFEITKNISNSRYSDSSITNDSFEIFCTTIYSSSSKYIPKF